MNTRLQKRVLVLALLLVVVPSMAMTSTLYTFAKSEQGQEQGQGEEHANENSNKDDSTEETEETEETDTEVTEEAAATDPTPGVGNNDNELGTDNPQPDRVGSHDDDDGSQTSPESNPGPTATDPTLCDITDNPDCSTTVDKNCFGKVISERAQDHKDEPEEGTLGSHSRDPVPDLEGNETPRQGIGNQDQGHPSAHGAFNSQFEDEDEQNVIDNC